MSIKGDLFIVSDSLDNCRVLEEDLVDTDWQVTQFEDISEAIAAIKTKRPAVVALDLPLDLMQDKFFALLSLDLATAYIVILPEVNPREVAKFFHQNASDVLIKPFAENRFQEAIERASEFKSLIRQNLEYRQQLEQANSELNDSLHLLELDQIAGSQIQNSLLPPTPLQKDKYEIAYRISPSLYLSGDFVGYNILYDRYLVFYVADVSGHGSSSAFLTVLLKFVFSRLLKRHKANKDLDAMSMAPKGFIEHINRQIMALDLDKHLTIFAGSLDMQKNILRYSVASHMPMPVLISNGGVQTLKGRGKPVGIFSKCSWEVQEIKLPDKFLLALVSDGVLELLPGKSLKEKEKFISDSVSQSDESIEDICERLGVSKNKKDAPDDVTVLTLRKGG
ncbi:MAG: sigma-B regulation protein RsbU (phosphoserine phosphatase) [Porticoccus sp.]|jgi:sigma-B regulation protein RsbU (phosphoserine phosphatase)